MGTISQRTGASGQGQAAVPTILFTQVNEDKLTFVLEVEGQACPVVKPDRIGCIAVFGDS